MDILAGNIGNWEASKICRQILSGIQEIVPMMAE